MIKTIGYAYATSSMARRLGQQRDGCYYVATKRDELQTSENVETGPFVCIEDAEAFAATINLPWSRFSKRAAGRVAA